MTSLDLSTPVGRRAVKAVGQTLVRHDSALFIEIGHDAIEEAVQAALAVLQSDVCQTCGGDGLRVPNSTKEAVDTGTPYYGENAKTLPCLACDNGKVKPALLTWEQFEAEWEASAKAIANAIREEQRSDAIEEVVKHVRDLRDQALNLGNEATASAFDAIVNDIERRERER